MARVVGKPTSASPTTAWMGFAATPPAMASVNHVACQGFQEPAQNTPPTQIQNWNVACAEYAMEQELAATSLEGKTPWTSVTKLSSPPVTRMGSAMEPGLVESGEAPPCAMSRLVPEAYSRQPTTAMARVSALIRERHPAAPIFAMRKGSPVERVVLRTQTVCPGISARKPSVWRRGATVIAANRHQSVSPGSVQMAFAATRLVGERANHAPQPDRRGRAPTTLSVLTLRVNVACAELAMEPGLAAT